MVKIRFASEMAGNHVTLAIASLKLTICPILVVVTQCEIVSRIEVRWV